ncbi:MAG: hypothetical protein NT178_06230 [Proteobacteria bacterium]|nr:hypothetical protein [Pseudomonadota bacterium]
MKPPQARTGAEETDVKREELKDKDHKTGKTKYGFYEINFTRYGIWFFRDKNQVMDLGLGIDC